MTEQGQIQRLKKVGGGGAYIECGVDAAHIAHSVLGGLGKFRPYESASEAVGDHHNHTNLRQLECY